MIPVLGIPHYNRPDLLLRCLRSIDEPVERLVIIHNGELCDLPALDDLPGNIRWTTVIQHPNAGVAGSWNEIIKLFPAAWWLICNNDIAFAPGDLNRMAQAVDEQLEVPMPGLLYGNHGASWFAITSQCVDRAGLFDENIYPAYLEDCDYSRRCDLLGVRRVNVPGCLALHGEGGNGSCTIHSDPVVRAHNHRTHGGNFEYYRAKWGGINGQETFGTPFNDPAWPVWAWRFDPARRRNQQW
jgi:GT2 family glycosyltransferase